MKKYTTFVLNLLFATVAIMTGCKKTDTPNPVSNSSLNTPNFVSRYFTIPSKSSIAFFDLNHDDNKDKKYFIAELMFLGSDTMKISDGPFPITNLASNWPSNVKDVGMGYTIFDFPPNLNSWVVTSSMGIRLNAGNAQYDSLKILNGISPNESPYDDPRFARSMAGKTPQGYTLIQVPSGVGGSTPMYPIFYFKEGYYVDKPYSWATIDAKPITSLVPGGAANKYDWSNVDNVISFPNDAQGNFNTNLFFDFKNWRYFTWKEDCAFGCTERTLTMSPYKSLDGLLKWPAGWGKK